MTARRVPARRRPRPAGAVSAAAAAAARRGQPGAGGRFAALRRLRSERLALDDSAAALPELRPSARPTGRSPTSSSTARVKRRSILDAVLGAYTEAPLERADPDVRDALRLARLPAAVPRPRARVRRGRRRRRRSRRGSSRRAGGFVNAVLRRVAREGRDEAGELGEGDDVRAWAVRSRTRSGWCDLLRDGARRRRRARRCWRPPTPPPERCLRANRLRGGARRRRERRSRAEGSRRAASTACPTRCSTRVRRSSAPRAFRDGLVTPQSRGSQIAGARGGRAA